MNPLHWRLSTAAIGLCAAAVLCPGRLWAADTQTPAPASATPAPEKKDDSQRTEKAKWYRGSFSAGFDGIFARGGDMDLRLDESLQFQIDPPQCTRLHLRGSLWMIENLDSEIPRNSVLRDINDSFQSEVQARVPYLYLDVDDLWMDSTLRVGRQRIMEGAAFNRIDGVYFKQRLKMWDWYVFGGTRASFYDDNFQNPVVGGGASVSPFKKTKIALDTYYGHEDRAVGHVQSFHGPVAALLYSLSDKDVKEEVNDVSVTLRVWQTVCQYLSLFGRFNYVSDNGDELLLNATGFFPEPWDVTYEITYRHQFNSIGDHMSDVTGYYRLLGAYEAYDDVFLALHRPITKQITLSLEGELHDSHQKNWSNRDYQRFAAIVSGEKLFKRVQLDAKIGLERWNVSQGEGTWAVTGEVGRRWKTVQVAVGTDFQRYEDRVTVYNHPLKIADMVRVWFAPGILQGYNPLLLFYDHYGVQMHQNIYTVYAKTKWSIGKNQDLGAKLTFEEDDGPDSPNWRVQANYTIRF